MRRPLTLCTLLAFCAFGVLTDAAQQPDQSALFTVTKDAAARAKVAEIRPPLVAFRESSWLSLCGSRSYIVKDSAAGYFMFTTHTPDMPHPITVDNPLLRNPENPEPLVDPASTFVWERPMDRAEKALLVKLLQEWRDKTIPHEILVKFERYSKLRNRKAIKRALQSLSKEDDELLGLWFAIRELQGSRR